MKNFHKWVKAGLCLPAVFAMTCFMVASVSHADRFYLSKDRLIEGILVHEDSRSVSFALEGSGVWTLSRKALYRMERENPGAYWLRVGDRHQERERIEEAKNAFQEAAKDPQTRKQAERRLKKLEAPVVEEELVKAIVEDDAGRPVKEIPEESPKLPEEKPVAAVPQPRLAQTSSPAENSSWMEHVRRCSREQGIDPLLVRAIIEVESQGNPRATSKSGAKGLMQLMPKTASALGVRNPYDPEQNIRGGVKYLGYLMKQFSNLGWPDRIGHVVAAYHAGPNRVKEAGDYRRIPAASRYAEKVMAAYQELRETTSGEVAFANHRHSPY